VGKAVDKENERMVESKVFKPVQIEDVPDDISILTETWSMKKKARGVFRARVTACGFKQIDGEHFDSSDIAVPVVSELTIHVFFILITMAQLYTELMDGC
jgi:hypothetical protein